MIQKTKEAEMRKFWIPLSVVLVFVVVMVFAESRSTRRREANEQRFNSLRVGDVIIDHYGQDWKVSKGPYDEVRGGFGQKLRPRKTFDVSSHGAISRFTLEDLSEVREIRKGAP